MKEPYTCGICAAAFVCLEPDHLGDARLFQQRFECSAPVIRDSQHYAGLADREWLSRVEELYEVKFEVPEERLVCDRTLLKPEEVI